MMLFFRNSMHATLALEFENEAAMLAVLDSAVLHTVGWPVANVAAAIADLNIGPRDFASGDQLKTMVQCEGLILR